MLKCYRKGLVIKKHNGFGSDAKLRVKRNTNHEMNEHKREIAHCFGFAYICIEHMARSSHRLKMFNWDVKSYTLILFTTVGIGCNTKFCAVKIMSSIICFYPKYRHMQSGQSTKLWFLQTLHLSAANRLAFLYFSPPLHTLHGTRPWVEHVSHWDR